MHLLIVTYLYRSVIGIESLGVSRNHQISLLRGGFISNCWITSKLGNLISSVIASGVEDPVDTPLSMCSTAVCQLGHSSVDVLQQLVITAKLLPRFLLKPELENANQQILTHRLNLFVNIDSGVPTGIYYSSGFTGALYLLRIFSPSRHCQ